MDNVNEGFFFVSVKGAEAKEIRTRTAFCSTNTLSLITVLWGSDSSGDVLKAVTGLTVR
jgi:hypothetical protein